MGRELGRYGIQIAADSETSETRFAEFGKIKEVGAGYAFFWSGEKVKRSVKQELAFPLNQNLLVSFQDCQNASMTA